MISLAKFLYWKDPAPPLLDRYADPQPDLSVALRQAMRLLLEGIPLGHGADDHAEEESQRTIAGLLDRLEGALLPLDAIDIANTAVTLFEQDALFARSRENQH